ncbi:MAG: XRE family transcriptional regulator [Bdellovibrionota bacterium]
MAKFPSEKELKEVREALEKGPASRMLPPNASAVEKLKFSLCEQFVIYLLDHRLTQRDLAEKIGIDESLMSKIVHYNFDDFTIDRLVKYLSVLFPKADLEILIKKKNSVA